MNDHSPTDSHTIRIPPLPPAIQTSILSHLLPPQLPLPQHLLAKSLLQRHLYLPPSPDDLDSFLSPIPEVGVCELLERLVGTGWRVRRVRYGCDGESILAKVEIGEEGVNLHESEVEYPHGSVGTEGIGPGTMSGGVDVLFEWEEGKDGRGWCYLSCTSHKGPESTSTLEWTSDPTSIRNPNITSDTPSSEMVSPQKQEQELDSGDVKAPEGYWTGFSPPSSPSLRPEGGGEGEGEGEDDYWASYDKAYTPAASGRATPMPTPGPSRQHSYTKADRSVPHPEEGTSNNNHIDPKNEAGDSRTLANHDQGVSHENGDHTQIESETEMETLLHSRMRMKIASLLKRLWRKYLPTSDPEYRALTFLSLARSITISITKQNDTQSHGHGGDDTEGIKENFEILYEIYQVLNPKQEGVQIQDGFYRMVEASLAPNGEAGRQEDGNGRGFGVGDRQDSSAQLNYWE